LRGATDSKSLDKAQKYFCVFYIHVSLPNVARKILLNQMKVLKNIYPSISE